MRLQCVAALVLGAAVLLSALFWLPPLAGRGRGPAGATDPFAVTGQCGISTPDPPALPDLASVFAGTGCRPGLRLVRTARHVSGSGCTDRAAAAVGGIF